MEENPIDKDKITETPNTIEYPHTIGAPTFKPVESDVVKSRAFSAMEHQTNRQLDQIKKQMELLAMQARQIKDRIEMSKEIYSAEIGFEPLIGKIYYLYSKDGLSNVLSLVGPDDWGKSGMPYSSYLCKCQLLADHTWDILEQA